jgi:hypothetical protein
MSTEKVQTSGGKAVMKKKTATTVPTQNQAAPTNGPEKA